MITYSWKGCYGRHRDCTMDIQEFGRWLHCCFLRAPASQRIAWKHNHRRLRQCYKLASLSRQVLVLRLRRAHLLLPGHRLFCLFHRKSNWCLSSWQCRLRCQDFRCLASFGGLSEDELRKRVQWNGLSSMRSFVLVPLLPGASAGFSSAAAADATVHSISGWALCALRPLCHREVNQDLRYSGSWLCGECSRLCGLWTVTVSLRSAGRRIHGIRDPAADCGHREDCCSCKGLSNRVDTSLAPCQRHENSEATAAVAAQ